MHTVRPDISTVGGGTTSGETSGATTTVQTTVPSTTASSGQTTVQTTVVQTSGMTSQSTSTTGSTSPSTTTLGGTGTPASTTTVGPAPRPTDFPTPAPTPSPSLSPTASPTASPTTAPTPTPTRPPLPTPPPPTIDLTVASITVSASSTPSAVGRSVSATVTNAGPDATVRPVPLRCVVATNATTTTLSAVAPSLASGESADVVLCDSCPLCLLSVAVGPVQIECTVDPDDELPERDELNNGRTETNRETCDVTVFAASADFAGGTAGVDLAFPCSMDRSVTLGDGDDTLTILSPCQLAGVGTVDGGDGIDTLVVPAPVADLTNDFGTAFTSWEVVQVVQPAGDHAHGACVRDASGALRCCCCEQPWEGSDCESCPAGTAPVNELGQPLQDADEFGLVYEDLDANDPLAPQRYTAAAVDCAPVVSCAELDDCGSSAGRGVCLQTEATSGDDATSYCACIAPATGEWCNDCAEPYTLSAATGACVLDTSLCRDTYCFGRGECVVGATAWDISCACDAAVDTALSPRCGQLKLSVIPGTTNDPLGSLPGAGSLPGLATVPAGGSAGVKVDECIPSACAGDGYDFTVTLDPTAGGRPTDTSPPGSPTGKRQTAGSPTGDPADPRLPVLRPGADGRYVVLDASGVSLGPGEVLTVRVTATPKATSGAGDLPCEGYFGSLGVGLFGATDLPEAGNFDPAFDLMHTRLRGWMQQNEVPGAVLGIARQGQIIHTHAFGWADRDLLRPMSTSTVQRIASVTKPITRAAVEHLAEQNMFANQPYNNDTGRYTIDDLLYDILGQAGLGLDANDRPLFEVPDQDTYDESEGNNNWDFSQVANQCELLQDGTIPARLRRLTLTNIIEHRSGLHRGANFEDFGTIDPTLRNDVHLEFMNVLGYRPPQNWRDLVKLMAMFCYYGEPGTIFPQHYNASDNVSRSNRYSNLAYTAAARAVEVVTGMDFWEYLYSEPTLLGGLEAGLYSGKTKIEERSVFEPRYYHSRADAPSVFEATCVNEEQSDEACEAWTTEDAAMIPPDQGGNRMVEFMVGHGDAVSSVCAYLQFMQRRWLGSGRDRTAPGATPGGTHSGRLAGVETWAEHTRPFTNRTLNVPLGFGFTLPVLATLTTEVDWVVWTNGNWKSSNAGLNNGLDALRAHMLLSFAEIDEAGAWPTTPTECAQCGNGIVEEFEQCDAPSFANDETCLSLTGLPGTLDCNCACTFDTSSCCGNSVKGRFEVCDGSDFGADSCGARGFDMGDLACLQDCQVISDEACDGDKSTPPGSYEDCGDIEFLCGEDPTPDSCDNADGLCVGGPCLRTRQTDFLDVLTKFSNGAAEFHPDGTFRDPKGNLYYCIGENLVCGEDDGWGVCLECGTGEGQTLVGCPCNDDAYCEQEAGLTCYGEDFASGPGLCWSSVDGPPSWQCIEGFCGGAPRGSQPNPEDELFVNDETFCQHYGAIGAICQNFDGCLDITVAQECADQGRYCNPKFNGANDDDDDSNDEKCALGCIFDEHCQTSGWPNWVCDTNINRCVPPF